jgi:hypothetical protein
MRPSVLVLTFPKTGSTSLYNDFASHRQICLPFTKESWAFDDENRDRGKSIDDHFSHCKDDALCVDFISTLMYSSNFSKKILANLPEGIKIIVLLRDPINRAISHYHHECRVGIEQKSIIDAFNNESERLKNNPGLFSHQAYSGIGKRYLPALEEIFDVFDRQQIHILWMENLISHPTEEFQKIATFLGIENSFRGFSKKNQARTLKSFILLKVLSVPGKLFVLAQQSLLRKLIPRIVRDLTRSLRAGITKKLDGLVELAFTPKVNTNMDESKVRLMLKDYFRDDLVAISALLTNNDFPMPEAICNLIKKED